MGLLDGMFDSEGGRLGLGLLAAGSARSDGAGAGQRLMEAVGSVDQWKKAKAAEEMQRQQLAAHQQAMQMQAMQMQAMQKQAEDAQAFRSAATSAFVTPEQASGQSMGPMPDGSSVPQVQSGFNDQRYIQNLQQLGRPLEALQHQAAIQKDDAPVKLGQGDQLFSGRASGYKPLASVPAKPEATPAALQEYLFAVNQGEKRNYTEWAKDQKRSGASNINVPVNLGQKGFDNTLKLRGDFRSEPIYKAHQEVQSAYSQIQQSLKMASPVGDLAGATKIMKLLDPGSVVRESELGMAMAASGALDRLTNYAGNVMNGTKLTPTQRVDFQKLADALYKESANQYNGKRSEYQGIADRNGLNVQDVLGNESNKSPATKRYNEKTGKMEAI